MHDHVAMSGSLSFVIRMRLSINIFMELQAKDESTGTYSVISSRGVGLFDLVFFSFFFFTKVHSFCAHWKRNVLNFPKLTLLLSLAHF